MYQGVQSTRHEHDEPCCLYIPLCVFISHYAPSQSNMYHEPLTEEITTYNLIKGQFVHVKLWPIDSVQVSTDMIQWLEP